MNTLLRTLLLAGISLLSSFNSFSQQVILLSPLRKEIADRQFFISEIIDARSEKRILGVAQTLKDNREIIEFKNEFQEEMKNFLKDLLQPKSTLTPVLMRVLKLAIYETKTATGSEDAQAELIIEFYQKTEKGLILLKSVGSTVTKSAAISVTRFYDESIASCFRDCLSQLNVYLKGNYLPESINANDKQELFKTPGILNNYDFPIVRDTIYRKGIYKNFIEFRNNNPSLGQDVRKVMMGNEARALGGAWGYSDGENIFIQLAGRSFELETEDNIFWFYGYEIEEVKGKVTGEALIVTLFTGNLMVQSSIKSKLVKYAINLGNGDLFPLD